MSDNTAIAESHRETLSAFADGTKSAADLATALGVTKVTVYRWLDLLGLRKKRKVRVKRRTKAVAHVNGDNGAASNLEFTVTKGHVTSSIRALSQSDKDIVTACANLANMLVKKNRAYGDSALDPVRVFSKADPQEQLRVRLDDKISRIVRGEAAGEDVEADLLGYLLLLGIARARARRAAG